MPMQRDELLKEILWEARETASRTGRAAFSPAVMDAVKSVPREAFVPDALVPYAYENRPLPIGHEQTISQPYIVALMTDLLDLAPGARVLEVGTGCGYQTAILSLLAGDVYTIEIVAPLGEDARDRLDRLGYGNVHVKVGDGYAGWPEHAPYDGIIVTAAAPEIPEPLLDQLAIGGILVIPVGYEQQAQQLLRVTRTAGGLEQRVVLPVAFVPFTGQAGGRATD